METAAGIILIKHVEGVPHILCLRVYGNYDLPKGRVEEGESLFEAAVRETREEAGISEISYPWGLVNVTLRHPKRIKEVTLFVGTTTQEPRIEKNPVTGQFEHHGIAWLPLDVAEMRIHVYLRDAIAWVRQIAGGNDVRT